MKPQHLMHNSLQNKRLNTIHKGSYIYSQHAMPQTVMSLPADCHCALFNSADRSNLHS